MSDCPCGSGSNVKECCGPYLEEGVLPNSAEALMRSRYTAYVKRDTGYLLDTWHPMTRPDPDNFTLQDDIFWQGLDVLETENGGKEDEKGTVTFVARFLHSERPCVLSEKSRFVKKDGKWLYVDGDIREEKQAPKEKVGRNSPCPCGSGRKYKKCCMR